MCRECEIKRRKKVSPYNAEYRRAYYLANKEKSKEQSHQHYLANKESYAERGKKWRQENPEKNREYSRKNYWKGKEVLSDAFVKHLLTSSAANKITLSKKVMPKELIELKRAYLLLKRAINE